MSETSVFPHATVQAGNFEGESGFPQLICRPLSSSILADGGVERGARSLCGRTLYSCRLRSLSLYFPPASSISLASLLLGRFGGVGGGVSGKDGRRLVVFYLLAMWMELLCSPGGFFFRIGEFVAGSGFTVGLRLLAGSSSASFSFGRLVLVLLEDAPPFLSTVRSPILFQRSKYIFVGGPGWWLMRLYQGLESFGGGSGSLGFDFASGA